MSKQDFLWKCPQGEVHPCHHIVAQEETKGCNNGCKLKLVLFCHSLILAREAKALIPEIKRILTCVSPPVQQIQDPVLIYRNCWQSNYYLRNNFQSIKTTCRKQQKYKMPNIKNPHLFFIGVSLELFNVIVCWRQWVMWPLFTS